MKCKAIAARSTVILLLIGMLTLAFEFHLVEARETQLVTTAGAVDFENMAESPAETLDLPVHTHLTWQQNNTSSTITVTWQTNSSTSGDNVLYDTVSSGGVPSNYCLNATGISYTYGGASGFIHDVELTGLTPDTTYYFICGGDAGGWSSERAFSTAPSVSCNVRFVVGGDSRTNLAERTKISKAMAKFNPSFVMHSGDMVADGRVQSKWDSWFTDVNDNWIGENNLTIPIMPVLGNHENPNFLNTKYFVQFVLPNNERWYSYDWGPNIHIICLDSESYALGDQLDWLQNDLAAHANYRWKFVLFHRPPFVSGGHLPWGDALTHWVPLFDKYHVDIVFNGHEHNYQRTYPLNWTASQNEPQDYSNGTMYMVSGGWGAPLYTPYPIWYMAHQNRAYHFCLVDVFENGTLHLQAKDKLGNTFDEVTIFKPPVHDIAVVGVTPSPTVVTTSQSVSINVTVMNEGTETETFNVSVYYNTTEIDTQTVTEMTPRAEKTLSFVWNTTGVPYDNYAISAYANPVPSEIDTADNIYTDGTVIVTTQGDLNGDGIVNILDGVIIAVAFGSNPGNSKWNPIADIAPEIAPDNIINIQDILLWAIHFGKTW